MVCVSSLSCSENEDHFISRKLKISDGKQTSLKKKNIKQIILRENK